MKLYKVLCERDGRTIKEPGVVETEIIREELLFAADKIEDVWNHTDWIRGDPERTMIGIVEVAPQVTIIHTKKEESK